MEKNKRRKVYNNFFVDRMILTEKGTEIPTPNVSLFTKFISGYFMRNNISIEEKKELESRGNFNNIFLQERIKNFYMNLSEKQYIDLLYIFEKDLIDNFNINVAK